MIFDTKYLNKLVELGNRMKTAFKKNNLTENVEEAEKILNYYNLFCGYDEGDEKSELYLPLVTNNGQKAVGAYFFALRKNIKTIVIADDYDTLSNRCFFNCREDLTVVLPNTIKIIANGTSSAFHGVPDLNLVVPVDFDPNSLDLQHQNMWSKEKVMTLVNNLAVVNAGDSGGKMLKLSPKTYSLLSESDIAIITGKGWAVSSA